MVRVPRTAAELAKLIDHTALGPVIRAEEIERVCREAGQFGFGAVCVASRWVRLAADHLRATGVRVVSVAGFPHGDAATGAKTAEAALALENGASEIDMVMSVGAFRGGRFDDVSDDAGAVARLVHGCPGAVLKVIIEAPLLSEGEIELASRLVAEAGADYVKTGTGFSGPASAAAVSMIRRSIDSGVGVKAAGGIRDGAAAASMVEAGADRIGCSRSVTVIETFSPR